jgi:hypothetical protein
MNKKMILALLFAVTIPVLKAEEKTEKQVPVVAQTLPEALEIAKTRAEKIEKLKEAKETEPKTDEEKTAKNALIEKLKKELLDLPKVSSENQVKIENAMYSFSWKSFGYSCAKYGSIIGLTALITYLIANKNSSNSSAEGLE